MADDQPPREVAPDRETLPLRGRVAVVTGVSRRAGIGYAIARRLAGYGAGVLCHHHVPHDERQPWGADSGGIDAVLDGVRDALRAPGARVAGHAADLRTPAACEGLLDAAMRAFGHVEVTVCNQALSGSDGPLGAVDAAMLDAHWQVDARATILLARAFTHRYTAGPAGGGRLIMMTSGQNRGPMPAEVCYAAAKGALTGVIATLSEELAGRGITVNAVNPGPVDTGYASGAAREAVAARFPAGRWGEPDDPAGLVAWLATDEARWITGQVIDSEGGFRR